LQKKILQKVLQTTWILVDNWDDKAVARPAE